MARDWPGHVPRRWLTLGGWFGPGTWFAGLSTATKMLMILGAALLPLLILAILASINSARTSRASDVVAAQATLALSAERVTAAVTRATLIVRLSSDALIQSGGVEPEAACQRAATQLAEAQQAMAQSSARSTVGQAAPDRTPPVRFALFGVGNQAMCASTAFAPSPPPLIGAGAMLSAALDPRGEWLRVSVFDPGGRAQGQIEFPRATLAAVATPGNTRTPIALDLDGDGGTMHLFSSAGDRSGVREVVLSETVLTDSLQLRLSAAGARWSASDLVLVLLPVLLWVSAALIGWLVVERLLLRPLKTMQTAIAGYRPGTGGFELPAARGPAREIAELGTAFDKVTRTVSRHETELQAAVERQTRLVREVHHRVKNNLQVVASLLNLHSRGAASEEVAAAYATIQRRVDALAVVHRNHYAELEETRGIALKALVAELGSSLRASAPAEAQGMQIRLALDPLFATQDVAVSIAFLVTEMAEFAMLCGARLVAFTLEAEPDTPGRARLTIESDALRADMVCEPELEDRFNRIVTGLARQLRSKLEQDLDEGGYSLTVAVLEPVPEEAA